MKFIFLLVISLHISSIYPASACTWTPISNALSSISYAPTIDGGFVAYYQEASTYDVYVGIYDKTGAFVNKQKMATNYSPTFAGSILQMGDGRFSVCMSKSSDYPTQLITDKNLTPGSFQTLSISVSGASCFKQASNHPGQVVFLSLKNNYELHSLFTSEGTIISQSDLTTGPAYGEVLASKTGYFSFEYNSYKKYGNSSDGTTVSYNYISAGSIRVLSIYQQFHTYATDNYQLVITVVYDTTVSTLKIVIDDDQSSFSTIYPTVSNYNDQTFVSAVSPASETLIVCTKRTSYISCYTYSLPSGSLLGAEKQYATSGTVSRFQIKNLATGGFLLTIFEDSMAKYLMIDAEFSCGYAKKNVACHLSNCAPCLILNEHFYCNYAKGPDACEAGYYQDSSYNCHQCKTGCQKCTSGSDCSECNATQNYMIFNNSCYLSCPTGSYNVSATKECKACQANCTECSSETSCSACNSGYFKYGSTCLSKCPVGYKEDGAARTCVQCKNGCSDCITVGSCEVCLNSFTETDAKCPCGAGTRLNKVSLVCESISILSIKADLNSLSGGISVSAQVLDEEVTAYPSRTYKWWITSTSTNTTATTLLVDFVKTVTSKSFTLDYKYLEPGVNYAIFGSFINALSQNLTNSTAVPNLNVLQAEITTSSQTTNLQRSDLLKFQFTISPAYSVLNNVYDLVATLDVPSTSAKITNGLEVTISRCVLTSAASKSLTVQSYLPANPIFTKSYAISIQTAADSFSLAVTTLDRNHPEDLPINLEVNSLFTGTCPDISSSGVSYTWTCQKSTDGGSTYSACTDVSSLFGVASTNTKLTIPKSYFAMNQKLRLSVSGSKGGYSATKTGMITVTSGTTLILSVNCRDSSGCSKYNSKQDMTLVASPLNDPGVSLQYTWSNSFGVKMASFGNTARLNFDSTPFGSQVLEVTATVSDSTYTGSGKISIRMNTAPASGSISISPNTGASASTLFTINATGWDASELPLKYQFFYTSSSGTVPISAVQSSSSLTTKLNAKAPSENIILTVVVIDNLGAYNTSQVSVLVTSTQDTVTTSFTSFIANPPKLTSSDPYSKTLDAALIASQINSLENSLSELLNNVTTCSGISCKCKGAQGTEVDCYVDPTVLAKSQTYKKEFISNLTTIYKQLQVASSSDNSTLQSARSANFASLSLVTSNTAVLTNDIATQVRAFLASLQSSDNSSFSKTEGQSASNVFSNIIQYTKNSDCNCATDFCRTLALETETMLDKIAKAGLADFIPGQDSYTIVTSNFELAAAKTSVCNLTSLILKASDSSPKVTLPVSLILNSDCSKTVTVKSYTFPPLFDCSKKIGRLLAEAKSTVMVKVVDSSGSDVTSQVTIQLEMPSGTQCPAGCTTVSLSTCICPATALSVTSQLEGIFSSKNTSDELKADDLPSLILFWVVIGVFAFCLLMAFILKIAKRANSYSIVEKIEAKRTVSSIKGLLSMYITLHDFLSINCVKSEVISKSSRILLYFVKIAFYVIFTILLAESSDENNVSNLLNKYLTPFLILVSYVTVLPAYGVLRYLMKAEARRMNRGSKSLMRTLIFFILAFVIGTAAVFFSFFIALKRGKSAQKVWVFNFVVTMIQELIVNPVIYLLLNFIMMSSKSCTSNSRISLVDDAFERIYYKAKINEGQITPEGSEKDCSLQKKQAAKIHDVNQKKIELNTSTERDKETKRDNQPRSYNSVESNEQNPHAVMDDIESAQRINPVKESKEFNKFP